MAYEWFKLYAEARVDKKLARLTLTERGVWINLLCFASEQDERGAFDASDRFVLAIECADGDEALLATTIEKLTQTRCIEPHGERDGWLRFRTFNRRQESGHIKPSDTPERVAERVARHREQQRATALQNSVTPCNAPVTPVTPCNAIEAEAERDPDPTFSTDGEVIVAAADRAYAPGGGESLAPVERNGHSQNGHAPNIQPTSVSHLRVVAQATPPPSSARPPQTAEITGVTQAKIAPLPTPATIPRAATDASALSAFVPLARQVAEAAHLSNYDVNALARVIHSHRAREPDELLMEATKAAEWIAEQKGKRQASVRFLSNWFDRAFTSSSGEHAAKKDGNSYANTRRRAGQKRLQTPEADEAEFAELAKSNAERRRLWEAQLAGMDETLSAPGHERHAATASASAVVRPLL